MKGIKLTRKFCCESCKSLAEDQVRAAIIDERELLFEEVKAHQECPKADQQKCLTEILYFIQAREDQKHG